MGTAATALQRSRANINTKRQQFYVRPQEDNTNRDEVVSLWPRGDAGIVFLRDLNTFSQDQTLLDNNEASSVMDPKRKAYGQYAAFTGTAPIYAKPSGALSSLPVEHSFLSLFYSAVDDTTVAAGSPMLILDSIPAVGADADPTTSSVYVAAATASAIAVNDTVHFGSTTAAGTSFSGVVTSKTAGVSVTAADALNFASALGTLPTISDSVYTGAIAIIANATSGLTLSTTLVVITDAAATAANITNGALVVINGQVRVVSTVTPNQGTGTAFTTLALASVLPAIPTAGTDTVATAASVVLSNTAGTSAADADPTTSSFYLVNAEADSLPIGAAIYVGTGTRSVRHIASKTVGSTITTSTLITLNAPLDFTPIPGDEVQVGPVTYSFNDAADIGLGSLLAQMDSMGDLVTQMYISKHTMDAANDQFLQHSFDIGGVKLFSGQQANFRRLGFGNAINYVTSGTVSATDITTYPNVSAAFVNAAAADTALAATALTPGTDITVLTVAAATTATIPAGLIVEILSGTGGSVLAQYVTIASSAGTSINLDEPLHTAIAGTDFVRIVGTGNWKFNPTDGNIAVNNATGVAVGATSLPIDGLGTALTNAPAPAGIPLYLGGYVYTTGIGSTTTNLVLSSPLKTTLADNDLISFATYGTIGLLDASRVGPSIAFLNSESAAAIADQEKFWAPSNVLKVDDGTNTGAITFEGWDRTALVTTDGGVLNTITGVWRGMEGTTIQATKEYDNLDLYFPTFTAPTTPPMQARKDVITLIGDLPVVTKAIRFAVDKTAAADDTERSLDDYAGLPIDDVRQYTLEIDANYHPSFFQMKWDSDMNVGKQVQSTIGPVRGKRISIYIPSATFTDPAKDAGNPKLSSTITAQPYVVNDTSQAMYLSYC